MKVSYSFETRFENLHGQVTLIAIKGQNCIVFHIRIDNATICRSRKITVSYSC